MFPTLTVTGCLSVGMLLIEKTKPRLKNVKWLVT